MDKEFEREIAKIFGRDSAKTIEDLCATVPQPVSPIVLYELNLENRWFEQKEFKTLVRNMEKDFDDACEMVLEGDRISYFSYGLVFKEAGKEWKPGRFGEFLSGGFFLNDEKNPNMNQIKFDLINYLQRQYKRSFREIISQYGKCPAPIDVISSLVGFRDVVMIDLPIKKPNENKTP